MKEVAKIVLFNENIDAKWDDRLNLEIGFFSKVTCTLGFKKLSNRKKHTRKLKKLLKNDNTLNLKDKKVIIYIDHRLLDRLIFFKDYPFIIREKYIKPAVINLFSNKGPAPFTTWQISKDNDFSKLIYDDTNEELKKITNVSKGF